MLHDRVTKAFMSTSVLLIKYVHISLIATCLVCHFFCCFPMEDQLHVCTCTTGIQCQELKPSSSIYRVNSKCHLFLPIGNKMVVATTKRKGIWFIKQLLKVIEKHCMTTHVTTTSSFLYFMSNLTLLLMFLISRQKFLTL